MSSEAFDAALLKPVQEPGVTPRLKSSAPSPSMDAPCSSRSLKDFNIPKVRYVDSC